ncbi:periplasmic binding protein [Solidesulfovibrio fructosivorans JJ]]|uniref:Periplasmic binding protein n=1 Tax=Solidesulfovibrio fructosivorans JJ] TaxID=596151 RepID=E1JU68_SOLFR|nr:ABC transporter substrate-binding protein [Solidesulfovibrio fructosivorans]EFL51998.1 periplasmic binding protein [Solidesulfovibrio fructosivorans JJ]]
MRITSLAFRPLRGRAGLLAATVLLAGSLVWPGSALARRVTDGCGRAVDIPDAVARVVTAGGTPSLNAFLVALGKGGEIVNGLPQGLHGGQWKYQGVFAPQVTTAPVVSSMGPSWTPDLEALMALRADLVLVESTATADMLSARGFPAYCLSWREPTAVSRALADLGDALGATARAKALQAAFAANLDRVARATADIPPDKRVKALYIRASGLMIPMVSTARFLIEKAGGTYAAPAGLSLEHPRISPEQLLAWDPDVLLVFNKKEVNEVLSDPRYATLSAVKRHAVAAVPFGMHGYTHFTPEQILAVLWMGKTLYPKRFKDMDLVAEAKDFYARFFGRELTDGQVREILRLP